MAERADVFEAAPAAVAKLRELGHVLNTESGLEPVLLALVRTRASRLNGCGYCIDMHERELAKLHEPKERVEGLADWRSSEAYTRRERAALAWTDALTEIQRGRPADVVYEELRAHFEEDEIGNLSMAIAAINGWNRLMIGLGREPGAKTGEKRGSVAGGETGG